ncbi:hypothetical protein [Pseudomonas sp. TMP25]|uniref:hypothetical protein n=1 Tax=Pseudomonas sp. TMP25 TaxID=3136561 RepID=UPI00310113CF
MTATKGSVIHLDRRDPQEALKRLNRVTGLRFSSLPHSLVNLNDSRAQAQVDETAMQPDSDYLRGAVARLSR